MLVSAIIPVYNGMSFVTEAVNSVLAQSHLDTECIVVDDGSTDETPELVAGFGSRVRLIRKDNGGVASARNAGIEAAKGELIAFLDADDVWLPRKLERQAAVMSDDSSCGLVYTGYRIVDSELRRRYDILPTPWARRIERAILLEGWGIGFSFTAMLRRNVLEVVGPFNETLSTSADVEYAWRVAQRASVRGVSESLALYRQHRSQMHDDLEALEHDLELVLLSLRAELGEAKYRRGLANLHTQLGARKLRRGQVQASAAHARKALATDPARLPCLPIEALARRVMRAGVGRWPIRTLKDDSIVE